MHILLFGGNGWIGQELQKVFAKDSQISVSVAPASCRCDDSGAVEEYIKGKSIDRIVCLVGRTHGPELKSVDYLELPGKLRENIRDNLFAPTCLALLCMRLKIHFTYIGTGCIFTGADNTSEQHDGNFFGSSYSTVKHFTDRMFRLEPFANNVLSIRIRMPVSADLNERSFLTKIITYKKICSMQNSISVLPTVLPILTDLIVKGKIGTYNLVNPGTMSHNEILELYKTIVALEHTWTNFTEEDQNGQLLSKRSNTHLDTTKIETEYPNIPPVKAAIVNILHKMV